MDIAIRNARLGDFGSIRRLLDEGGLGGKWFTRTLLGRLIRRNRGLYLVAESGEQVIGTVFGSEDGGYHGYICKLAVDRRFRRRGVARALVDRLKTVLDRRGVIWYFALIRRNNRPSQRLFGKLGFRDRDVFHVYEARGD